jgi:hypothetical protein
MSNYDASYVKGFYDPNALHDRDSVFQNTSTFDENSGIESQRVGAGDIWSPNALEEIDDDMENDNTGTTLDHVEPHPDRELHMFLLSEVDSSMSTQLEGRLKRASEVGDMVGGRVPIRFIDDPSNALRKKYAKTIPSELQPKNHAKNTEERHLSVDDALRPQNRSVRQLTFAAKVSQFPTDAEIARLVESPYMEDLMGKINGEYILGASFCPYRRSRCR